MNNYIHINLYYISYIIIFYRQLCKTLMNVPLYTKPEPPVLPGKFEYKQIFVCKTFYTQFVIK